jgi:hypothetical protein
MKRIQLPKKRKEEKYRFNSPEEKYDTEEERILKFEEYDPVKYEPAEYLDYIKFGKIIAEKQNSYELLKIPKTDSIINTDYRSFLCDLELFRLNKREHKNQVEYITSNLYSKVYITHLCKTLGNDITFYGEIMTNKHEISIAMPTDNVIIQRPIYRPPVLLEEIEFLKKKNLKNVRISMPIFIKENEYNEEYYYNFLYSPTIMTCDTRYALIIVIIEHRDESHFCFLFIDHEKKLVEFYDPHGRTSELDLTEFIYSCLIMLYIDYEVEDFWKMQGIQDVESEEKDNGFCVIWGNMMIHLKLLNIDKPIIEIEKLFVSECYEKNLSIYDVMLNYAYHMTRIVPRDMNKFIPIKKILSKN